MNSHGFQHVCDDGGIEDCRACEAEAPVHERRKVEPSCERCGPGVCVRDHVTEDVNRTLERGDAIISMGIGICTLVFAAAALFRLFAP